MTSKYVSCIMEGPQTKQEYVFTIHISSWHLEIWMELYSWHYWQESLFITTLSSWYYSIKNTIHKCTIIENTDTIHKFHTIHTNICHDMYQHQFLPMKVTYWMPVSDAKYVMVP